MNCFRTFSHATFQECYRQKKRRINQRVFEYLVSGVSQRRISKLLKINKLTVERKFLFLAQRAAKENLKDLSRIGRVSEVQFDDLETFEHTKCKPLSVAMAVQKHTRQIMGFSVSQMPAKGLLAKISRKKYGVRLDHRPFGWNKLFSQISPHISEGGTLQSDQNPHYPGIVKKWCPTVAHERLEGKRGCVTGQGELKKVAHDPLFTLNHTFAMFRANINRLIRKTWCTTKRPDRLTGHIELYVYYHNRKIIPEPSGQLLKYA